MLGSTLVSEPVGTRLEARSMSHDFAASVSGAARFVHLDRHLTCSAHATRARPPPEPPSRGPRGVANPSVLGGFQSVS